MNDVTLDTIGMLVLRHAAGWIAGIILAHGWANGATSEQIASALILLGTIGFSMWQKSGQAAAMSKLQAAHDRLLTQLKKPAAASVGKP
jgi:hypothetical protein